MNNKLRLCALTIGMGVVLSSTSGFAATKHPVNYKDESFKDQKVVAPVAVAVVPVATHQLKDGFYLGAQLGYDSYRARESVSAVSGVNQINANPAITAAGFEGGLFAGYGAYFDRFYLGAELSGDISKADASYHATATTAAVTANYNSRFKVKNNYGLSVIPGVKLSDTSLFYVRLGYDRANIQTSESYSATGGSAVSSTQTQWKNGFKYGLGMESLVSENVSVRGEFNHVNYNSFNTRLGTRVSPANNQMTIGLSYHFA